MAGLDPQTPQEWMQLADGELRAAEVLNNCEECLVRVVRHHCHGAAELYLKAFLGQYGAPDRTHDLSELLAQCCLHDASFGEIATPVQSIAVDYYPTAQGQANCESSVQTHYNPADVFDGGTPCDWLDAARQVRDFVTGKI